MEGKIHHTFLCLIFSLGLMSCSFNPLSTDKQLTGDPAGAAIGAGVGVGVSALLGGTKPAPLIAGGLIGGALGYYVTTLQFASAGVTRVGGQVFSLGDYVTINIPTDQLFEVNTAEFLDDAGPILDSTVAILNRYPYNNIIISGNTSGFSTARYEHRLSEARARQVAAYLWAHGISDFKYQLLTKRKLTYVGYGSYFPIANDHHNDSLRQNSRIQITAYPTRSELEIQKRANSFNNIGESDELAFQDERPTRINFGNQYSTQFHDEPSSRSSDYKGTYAEGSVKNTIIGTRGAKKTCLSENDVWGNYNKVDRVFQTTSGESVEKQAGFAGFKGEG